LPDLEKKVKKKDFELVIHFHSLTIPFLVYPLFWYIR